MIEILQLCGYFAIVFAVSVGASYALTSFKVRRRFSSPIANSTLRVRSGANIYRSKFVGETPAGWVIGAPLSRNSYVPLRVGEKLTVLAPTEHGLRQFDTEVLQRDNTTHEMTLKKPIAMTTVERRGSERIRSFLNPRVVFEGHAATLLDLSEGGARIVAGAPVKCGERAALDIPGSGTVAGWVLDSAAGCQEDGYIVRVRFEEEFAPRK